MSMLTWSVKQCNMVIVTMSKIGAFLLYLFSDKEKNIYESIKGTEASV